MIYHKTRLCNNNRNPMRDEPLDQLAVSCLLTRSVVGLGLLALARLGVHWGALGSRPRYNGRAVPRWHSCACLLTSLGMMGVELPINPV